MLRTDGAPLAVPHMAHIEGQEFIDAEARVQAEGDQDFIAQRSLGEGGVDDRQFSFGEGSGSGHDAAEMHAHHSPHLSLRLRTRSFTSRPATPTRRHFPNAGDFPSETEAKHAFLIKVVFRK